jgi:hypothetical protein
MWQVKQSEKYWKKSKLSTFECLPPSCTLDANVSDEKRFFYEIFPTEKEAQNKKQNAKMCKTAKFFLVILCVNCSNFFF